MKKYESKFLIAIKKIVQLVRNAQEIDDKKNDDAYLNDLENEINNL